jgi:hypothetical protein
VVIVDQLAPEEPLSPELVLVLPPELRAEALARLPPPVWPQPRPSAAAVQPPTQESLTRIFGTALLARVVQLVVIFLAVTALILVMAAVANAVR